jgi:hypothetical protein
LPASAQRLDGCLSDPQAPPTFPHFTSAARDTALKEAGYQLAANSLISALNDKRADIRSLAALKLALTAPGVALNPLMQAWLAEKDPCTRDQMEAALNLVGPEVAWDAAQHPGQQIRVTPNQPCKPSEPALLLLSVEQVPDAGGPGPELRISVRNVTRGTVAVFPTASPTYQFSATVLNELGEPVGVPVGQAWQYRPLEGVSVGNSEGYSTRFFPIPPQESASWTWRVGDDLNMSARGTYRVSLGGRIPYLNTTVCSNVAEVVVR